MATFFDFDWLEAERLAKRVIETDIDDMDGHWSLSFTYGLIQEDKSSWHRENLLVPVITLPLGPTLDGIYLRPAGSIEGYSYSRAFRELATGWVWDEDALDGWLTNSQEFVRGSTMWLKVEEPTRSKIIAYLKKYARHSGN